jgi:ABC-type dipeptide/oligopeptide/nickel transport system permease subunit
VAVTKLRAFLLATGLAAFLLAGATLPHLHASGEFGLWNEEHDLSLMAALGSAASLLDAAPVLALFLTLIVTLASLSFRVAGAPLRLADSRAPPAR